jgi:hypothetical protein
MRTERIGEQRGPNNVSADHVSRSESGATLESQMSDDEPSTKGWPNLA